MKLNLELEVRKFLLSFPDAKSSLEYDQRTGEPTFNGNYICEWEGWKKAKLDQMSEYVTITSVCFFGYDIWKVDDNGRRKMFVFNANSREECVTFLKSDRHINGQNLKLVEPSFFA